MSPTRNKQCIMTLFIKNMMCLRCKLAVKDVMDKLEIPFNSIEIGRVNLVNDISREQKRAINAKLLYYELEILQDKKQILAENIKILIAEMIKTASAYPPLKFTVYLSTTLGYDYTYLSNVFSEVEKGNTIEQFYIVSRVERVKELMVYEELSIKEIAYELNYSSVAHLCLQFKKITGQTPSSFKILFKSPNFIWGKKNDHDDQKRIA